MEQKTSEIKLKISPIPFPTIEEFHLLATKSNNSLVYRQAFREEDSYITILIEENGIDDPENGNILGGISARGGMVRMVKLKGINEENFEKICEEIERMRMAAIQELAFPKLSVIEKAIDEAKGV